jgi:hypothetical protein
MKLIHEVEHNEEVLEVEFEGYPRFEIETSYEFSKFGKEYAYASFEEVSYPIWDLELYSNDENISIIKELDEVMMIMIKELEKEAKEMEGEY